MYELPKTVQIGDNKYPIRNDGDYRMVLDCFIMLQDGDIESEFERILASLIIFYADLNVDNILLLTDEEIKARVNGMFEFFDCGQDMSNAPRSSRKLMDWKEDEQLIISAINNVANKEVRAEEYLHWWTFMGYYMGIGECAFSTIISIRYKIAHHKKLEKHERDFKNENPQYFIWNQKTIEEQQAEQLVLEMWNKNSRKED